MNINEFQEQIVRCFELTGQLPGRTAHTKQSATIHLMEEIGEIARQVTNEYHRSEKFDKINLGTELADALIFISLLAKLYDVDLSKEMQQAIIRMEQRANLI